MIAVLGCVCAVGVRASDNRESAFVTYLFPLPGVPRSGNDGRRRQMGPEEYEQRFGKLVFIPPEPGAKAAGYLAAKGGVRRRGQRQPDRYRVLYILVREVMLPQRLRPDEVMQRWADLVPGAIAEAERRIRGAGA